MSDNAPRTAAGRDPYLDANVQGMEGSSLIGRYDADPLADPVDDPADFDEAANRVHRAFCYPDEEVGDWDRQMAQALRRNGYVLLHRSRIASGATAGDIERLAVEAEAAAPASPADQRLREALALISRIERGAEQWIAYEDSDDASNAVRRIGRSVKAELQGVRAALAAAGTPEAAEPGLDVHTQDCIDAFYSDGGQSGCICGAEGRALAAGTATPPAAGEAPALPIPDGYINGKPFYPDGSVDDR